MRLLTAQSPCLVLHGPAVPQSGSCSLARALMARSCRRACSEGTSDKKRTGTSLLTTRTPVSPTYKDGHCLVDPILSPGFPSSYHGASDRKSPASHALRIDRAEFLPRRLAREVWRGVSRRIQR